MTKTPTYELTHVNPPKTFLGRLKEKITLTKNYGKGYVTTVASIFGKQGAVKPPNLDELERLYKSNGVVSSAVEQTVAEICGTGYYTSADLDEGVEEANPNQSKAKQLVDDFAEAIGLDQILIRITRDMLIYGNAYLEKIPAKENEKQTVAGLKILPPTTMEIDPDPEHKGKINGYIQKLKGEHKGTPFRKDQIIHFKFDVISSSAYGTSMIAPVFETVKHIDEIDKQILKFIKRYASPKIFWKLPMGYVGDAFEKMKNALANIPEDEDFVFTEDISFEVPQIDARGRFTDYLQMENEKVQTGLKTPLLSYLRNATEASAKVMIDYFKERVIMYQRYLKRMVEMEIFKPIIEAVGLTDLPRLNWGMEKTGIEEISLDDIANLSSVQSRVLSPFQARELLRKIGVPVEEEELPEESPDIMVTKKEEDEPKELPKKFKANADKIKKAFAKEKKKKS